MTRAGDLHYRVHCQKRTETDDGYGNTVSSDFQTQFTVKAAYRHLRGNEQVLAGRLEGVHPMIVTVRRSNETAQIGPDWRLLDSRDGKVFAVKDVTPETDRMFISLLVQSGVAG